jgi:ABC-type antimicrobial peptide transport system permease subunit
MLNGNLGHDTINGAADGQTSPATIIIESRRLTVGLVTLNQGIKALRSEVVIKSANFVVPALLLLGVCLLAGFLPANRAARLKPVEALREE